MLTRFLALAAICFAVTAERQAWAVPYASQVIQTGNSVEFVLNLPADTVTVTRDGGSPVVVDGTTAGRKTFDMTGFSTFEIEVANDTPVGWTDVSDPANLHTSYFRPTGVAVNQDPSSDFFGTVYVSHPIEIVGIPGTARDYGDGIYSLSADLVSVDLTDFSAETDPNDAALAKLPTNWTVDQNSGSSPWRLSLDDSGNVIAADFSDQHGGIKYSSPDLTTGGLVLANEDGVLPLLLNGSGEEVHGSILSKVSVTGSVGTDLTVWAIDEDYDLDGDTFTVDPSTGFAQNSTFHPLRWDVGSATDYDVAPTVVINKENLTVNDDNGTPGDTSDDFNDFQFTLSPESIGGVVINNMHYESQFDKFYLLQSRTHGNESGILIVTADGVDGNSPTIDWSSKRFSFDNGLDGSDSTSTDNPEFGEGIQDIFRNIDDLIISEDGTKMYVTRNRQFDSTDQAGDGNNPVLGGESNTPGGILVIPLDANGLPDIQIDDNGTPGDTSDDFITNIESIPHPSSGRTSRSQVAIDAAGNVYHVDNISERLFLYSRGGNTVATTTSDGVFSLIEGGGQPPLLGDADGDGDVDGDDLIAVQTQFGSTGATPLLGDADFDGDVDGDDLIAVQTEFGNTASLAVPEPSASLLAALAGLGLAARRRGRNRS